jgi:general secretion pathway protein E
MKNDLVSLDIDYSLCNGIDTAVLKRYRILPLKKETLYITIAAVDPDIEIKELLKIFNHPVKIKKIDEKFLNFELAQLELKKQLYAYAHKSVLKQKTNSGSDEIISFLELLLKYSVENKVSDIHIESTLKEVLIRIRVNGVLNRFFSFEKELFYLLSSIIKLWGNLDISQKRMPLNSRFSRNISNFDYDFRISTLPTIHGESIVLRILDNQNIKKDLDSIGFMTDSLEKIKEILSLNQGLILVTGPTGSGKTTTLYSMLNHINSSERKIITIEDPVEYKLDGIIQVNINQDIDLDYHLVLKNILRQDPDILMIGEIRDSKALQIALRASLTGHLVIATLHTNNTSETITRLLDLEAKPYLIAATLKMILSQRLLRTLCPKCKVYDEKSGTFTEKGCSSCSLTGYKSRHLIEEILIIDKEIQKMIYEESDITKILEYAKSNNFKTLKQNGLQLLKKGITSSAELKGKL